MILLGATLLLVIVAAVAHRGLGRDTGWLAAAALFGLGIAMLPWLVPITAGEVIAEYLPWIPSAGVGISLRLDGLALVFLLLVIFIGALVLAYSARYFSRSDRTGDYYTWMLLFVFAMTGMVLADDLILLFVFWEFTTLCSFFLINRSGEKAPGPAQRTLLITMAGGLGLLAAVLMIIVRTGTTRLSEALLSEVWTQDPVFTGTVAVLIAFAAFTKSAQFPFHWWLPDAMVAPAPVSAYLHAAAMVKAGIYLMLRFSPVLADVAVWQAILIAGGLTTALMGAVFALQRHDIKEIMAFSTVSQLGFLTATIGIGTPIALAAAVIHVIAHALFKSSLFMMVGIIEHEAHSRDIRALHGVRRAMKVSFVITAVAALSMAGVPPLLGFVSKENLLAGFLSAGTAPLLTGVLVTLAALAAVGTFAYCGRIVLGSFTGYTGRGPADAALEPIDESAVHEAPASFFLPALLPALAGVVFGFAPAVFDGLVSQAVDASTGAAYHAHFALWHGFTPELAISAGIITLGLLAVLGRASVDAVLPRTILPFTGVEVVERLRQGSIDFGRRVGDLTRTDNHGLHLGLPGVFLAALCLAGVILAPTVGSLDAGSSRPVDWILNALLIAFTLGAATTRNRPAAIVLAGGAGFVVAAWFFLLGAVDVGMTQLLVEILTVVVLVLVLRKLPRRFRKAPRHRTLIATVVALGFGTMAFLGTYALTGRRGKSEVAQYYLAETYNDTGATNIVNSILVDFRALDTFGELTVLGIAGFAILSLLNSSFSTSDNPTPFERLWVGTPIHHAADNTLAMRMIFNWVAPFIVLLSLMLLVRGHYESGGGFIAALAAGGFFALRYLVAESDTAVKLRFDYAMVTVGGIMVSAVIGFVGFVDGSFLRPIFIDIPLPWGGTYAFTTALIFDLGIYLAVIGSVLVALDRLGQAQRYPSELLEAHRRSFAGVSADATALVAEGELRDPGDTPPGIDYEAGPARRYDGEGQR